MQIDYSRHNAVHTVVEMKYCQEKKKEIILAEAEFLI